MRTPCFILLSVLPTALATAQCGVNPDFPALDHELVGATFGGAVVISADGTIAMASGPGFDGGDGIVRTFERIGGDWVEGTAYQGGQSIGEVFGTALAMNDAGDLAAISAPSYFNHEASPFVPYAGGVDIWERDPGTGEWARTHQFFDPDPGFQYGFGASVDLTPDGNTIVIGRAATLGTLTDPLPDAVFVATRSGGVWSPLTELMPDPAPDALDQFGAAVAIDDAGGTIAVGAPGNNFGPGLTGEIYIFKNPGGGWMHTETIAYRNEDVGFSLFGTAMAFAGDELLATDPAYGLFPFPPDSQVPLLFVYDGSDGTFGPTPDQEVEVPFSLRQGDGARGLGMSFSVRGSTALIGAPFADDPLESTAGAVFRVQREDEGWVFISRTHADEPVFGAGYGQSVALAANGVDAVIGEPNYEPSIDFFSLGRIHLGRQVFRSAAFRVQPALSPMSVELQFPGLDPQLVELFMTGNLLFVLPETCEPGDPVAQLQLVGASLTTEDLPITLMIAPGVELTVTDLSLGVVEPSYPSTVGPDGGVVLDHARFELVASMSINGTPPYEGRGLLRINDIPMDLGGDPQTGLTLAMPEFEIKQEIDAGMGDKNPYVIATVSLAAEENEPPCNAADLAEPFGLLDLADVTEFVVAFGAQDDAADLVEPFGLFDLADVVEFVVLFGAGCP